jgi:hypothetical protein
MQPLKCRVPDVGIQCASSMSRRRPRAANHGENGMSFQIPDNRG